MMQSMGQTKVLVVAGAIGLAAFGASSAMAQASSDIPAGYEALPVEYSDADVMTGADGVETVTRTRWIRRRAVPADAMPVDHGVDYEEDYYQYSQPVQAPAYQTAYPVTLDREAWLAECHSRTDGVGRKKKGGIIGALLGAITGGIIGNRAWDSERLGGTLIGAGVGGIAGAVIGSAIEGSGRDDYRYDCEAALDRYLSGASYPAPRVAQRSIPAYAPAYSQAYSYAPVAYAPVYAASYAYQQPMVMVEVQEEIPQQVVVREYVSEEWVDEPAPVQRERTIEEPQYMPAPQGKITPIKPAPRAIKQIKGN